MIIIWILLLCFMEKDLVTNKKGNARELKGFIGLILCARQ